MRRLVSPLAFAALLAVACVGKPQDAGAARQAAAHDDAKPASKPEFVKTTAVNGALPKTVQDSQKQADADGCRLVVYVGASWCEPCQRFHRAVEAGELDTELAGIRFLEFDADTDREALVDAGYGGKLIPRFALPGPDGRGTDAKIEGGVKGDGAVDHILGRLRPLLGLAS